MSTLGMTILAVAVVIIVLVLTIIQVNKSYAYKHRVDPLPENDEKARQKLNNDAKE